MFKQITTGQQFKNKAMMITENKLIFQPDYVIFIIGIILHEILKEFCFTLCKFMIKFGISCDFNCNLNVE